MIADHSTRVVRSHASRGVARWLDIALLVACLALSSAVSIGMGQDANWDLQNYHYYGPWALLAGRAFDWDVAAAQLQTYFNPILDLPFYAMVAADWDPRVISAALALPAGFSAWLLAKLAWALFGGIDPPSRLVAVAATLAIGLTAAMAVGTLGTTMNDWPGAALTLAALWLVVRAIVSGRRDKLPVGSLVAAGVLIGAASGLKLTVGTFVVGLCVGLILRPPLGLGRLRDAAVFSLAVLAGFALTYGYWAWQLWTHFGNPIFPYANRWLGASWEAGEPFLTRRYGPHNLREWLRFPLDLYAPRPLFVTEVPYADLRIPLTYVLAIIAGASIAVQRIMRIGPPQDDRPPPQVTQARVVVSVFWVASFILWTGLHSILRYIVVLEVTTGLLIVGLLRWMVRPVYANVVVATVAATLIATTQWSDWWRIEHGKQWFDVRVPAVEPSTLVLITSGAPLGYVLPFFPSDARHLAVRNNINDPEMKSVIAQSVEDAIRNHAGPLYSLSFPAKDGEEALEPHGLRRVDGACANVKTAMRTTPIELCRLDRVSPVPR
jgi:hypothetical protein